MKKLFSDILTVCLLILAGVLASGCAGGEAVRVEPVTKAWTSPAKTPPDQAEEARAEDSEPAPAPSPTVEVPVLAIPAPEQAVKGECREGSDCGVVSEPDGEPEETCDFIGVYHEVEKGETLWRIAKTYGVELETLQWVNDVEDVTDLRVGRVLFIPGVREVLVVPPPLPGELAPLPEERIYVEWPLKARLTSKFGMRGSRMHEGIDLAAPTGTPVRAAAPGKVVYCGSGMRGYGKVVVLKHEREFSTVYAHNSALNVKRGDMVEKGQIIARVGSTGRSTGPHLHFEVRRRGVAEDPLTHLPPL
ncbi:MAG: peptidoglycan DD-metalloendopeptidase family protein [Proteobacteria bacterium]|nr:peptidoglycan DD-metalloendopeptidase family protein [Pseudomonadota bacterium]